MIAKTFLRFASLLFLLSAYNSHSSTKLTSIDVAAFIYPPFSFVDSEGEWKGADIELTTALLKEIGYAPNYLKRPFKRLIIELQEGKVPLSVPIVEGNNREEFVYFTEPLSYLYNVLWKRKDRNIQWKDYSDLKNLTIGATKGYHYCAGFKEAGDNKLFTIDYMTGLDTEFKNFKKTVKNRIDMFICEINVGRHIQNQHSQEFSEIDYATTGVGPKRPFSIAVSKSYYQDRNNEALELVDGLNKALDKLAETGVNKQIFRKYNMAIELDINNKIIIDKEWRKQAE